MPLVTSTYKTILYFLSKNNNNNNLGNPWRYVDLNKLFCKLWLTYGLYRYQLFVMVYTDISYKKAIQVDDKELLEEAIESEFQDF